MSIEHYILPNEGDPLVSDDGNSFAIVMNLNTLTRPKRAPTNSIYRGIYSVSHTHTRIVRRRIIMSLTTRDTVTLALATPLWHNNIYV